MAIKTNPDTYDNASEILSSTEAKLNEVIEEIKTVNNNIDSRIASYVSKSLISIVNNIDDVNYNTHVMSDKIEAKAEEFRNIEKKASKAIKEVSTLAESAWKSATDVIGTGVGKVVANTASKYLVENADIANATASIVTETSSKVEELFTAARNTIGNVVNDIENAISDTAAKVTTKAKSAFDWVVDKAKTVGSFTMNAITHPLETLKKTGASIANTVVALVQGIAEFGEAINDALTLAGAIVATPIFAVVDGFQWLAGKITGNDDWHSVTKTAWNETMNFVSTKYVTNAFDSFHQENAIGMWLDENSYSPFKSTGAAYKVADGIGYIGGILLLTMATMGIGGVVAGAGSSAGTIATINIGNVATISITQQAVTSGVIAATAGFGKNTQNAWADGASLGEGLTYGAAMGLWEGAEMFLGAEINALKFPGLTGLNGQLITTGSHVALDTIDGATGALVNPLMQMIYNPNEQNIDQIMYLVNYDENGIQISNKTWDDLTFTEKYQAMFEYNGGWGAVGTQALSAGVMSFLTEIPDIRAAASALTTDEVLKRIAIYEKDYNINIKDYPELEEVLNGTKTITSKELDNIVTSKIANLDINTKDATNIDIDPKRLTELEEQINPKLEEINKLMTDTFADEMELDEASKKIAVLKREIFEIDATPSELSRIIPLEKQISMDIKILDDNSLNNLRKILEINSQTNNLDIFTEKQIRKILENKYIDTLDLLRLTDYESYEVYNLIIKNISTLTPTTAEKCISNLLSGLKISDSGKMLTSDIKNGFSSKGAYNAFYESLLYNLANTSNSRITVNALEELTSGTLSSSRRFEIISSDLSGYCKNTPDAYTSLYNAIQASYNNGQTEIALHNLEALAYAIHHNKLSFKLIPGEAFVSGDLFVLDSLQDRCYETAYHEFGHFMHNITSNRAVPENFEDILLIAQRNASQNFGKLSSFMEKLNQSLNNKGFQAAKTYDDWVRQTYGSVDGYKQYLRQQYAGWDIETIIKNFALDEKTANSIRQTNPSLDSIINVIYTSNRSIYVDQIKRQGSEGAISDMVSAIFRTDDVKINGQSIPLSYRHPLKYWRSEQYKSIAEIMANYNQMQMLGDNQNISMLREIFGDEFMSMIEKTYKDTYKIGG